MPHQLAPELFVENTNKLRSKAEAIQFAQTNWRSHEVTEMTTPRGIKRPDLTVGEVDYSKYLARGSLTEGYTTGNRMFIPFSDTHHIEINTRKAVECANAEDARIVYGCVHGHESTAGRKVVMFYEEIHRMSRVAFAIYSAINHNIIDDVNNQVEFCNYRNKFKYGGREFVRYYCASCDAQGVYQCRCSFYPSICNGIIRGRINGHHLEDIHEPSNDPFYSH